MRAIRVSPPVALALCACGEPADTKTDFAPDAPLVIDSTPSDGDLDVDAGLEHIIATFDRAMDPGGWSWVTEVEHSAPSVTGIPFYIDDTTTVLPVRLEPHTSYAIWLNSPEDAGLRKFMSSDGVTARAHRIAFSTGAAE